MGVVLKFGGDKKVDLDSLPLSVIEQIEDETDRSWSDIYARPFMTAKTTLRMFEKVGAHFGYPVPELTFGNFGDHVEVSPGDDRPTEYEDGVPLMEGDSSPTN